MDGTRLTGTTPLLARDAEMDRIAARLAAPSPCALVLAGGAGVGKTRLAAEAATAAGGLGFGVVHASATRAAAAIPFGPFAPFLPPAGQSPADLLGLLHTAGAAISERAGADGKLLLLVDDAHFLDEGSAALVYQLVRERTCGVLVSVRAPGPAPDPVIALWKDRLAERIDVGTWDEAQTEAVIAGYLGGPVASGSVRRLWELSQGNALYLRELLAGAVDSGALAQAGGIWALRAPLTPPGRLVELVAARLAGLRAGTVAVIEMLAAGEPLGVPLLEKITDPAGLEDAEAQGLVLVGSDGRRTVARLAHPVYGEALRNSMPRSRLRRLSALLAGTIEATGTRRRDDLLRLGRWQLDSGQLGDALVLTKAAARASEVFDLDLSARLAEAALAADGGVDAGLLLGEALFRSGQHQEAEKVLAGLVALCAGDRDQARIASARAYNFHNLLADPAAAMTVLDEALTVITEAGPRLQVLGRLASLKVFEGEPEAALAAAGPLCSSEDDAIACRGAYVSSIALALLGRGTEAVSVAHAGLERNRRTTGLTQLAEAQLLGSVMGYAACGKLAEALADCTTGYQACLAAGDREGQATFLFLRGGVLIERGLLAAAARAFGDGAAVNREIRDPAALRWCLAGTALAEAMRGHLELARAAAAERDELPASPMRIYDASLIERGSAWVLACGGELTRACEILTLAAERAGAGRLRVAEATVLHDIARLGQPEAVAGRLGLLAGEAPESAFVFALASHAAALAAPDAAGLEAAGVSFADCGAVLLAAEAFLAAAAAYRSDGGYRAASAMTRRASELAAECGDVRTPGLSQGTASGRLTRREREVAVMAAGGASSREIADRLVLSVRTVDNHLQNVYSKLGVTRRDELARVLES